MQRDSIPCLKSYSPALGFCDHLDFFGDVFRLPVDPDAVELGPIAGDPSGVARVRVLALFYGEVDKDCVVQHQCVGDWHGQQECVYYLHFLDYGLFYEDGVIYEQCVHLDFHLAGMGISALVDEVPYCVDDVEKQQDCENEGYDFEKILDSVVFDVHSVQSLGP